MRYALYLLASLGLVASAAFAAPSDNHDPIQDHSLENLIYNLNTNQRDYYYSMFEYAMQNLKPGEKQEWATGQTSGNFVVDHPFVHDNTVCRYYRETVATQGMYSVSAEGIGCKRLGREGWCKLKKGDAATCAMEAGDSLTHNSVVNEIEQGLDSANTDARSIWYRLWNK